MFLLTSVIFALVISTLILIVICEDCVTPYNRTGKCIDLHSCPDLVQALATAKTESVELVRKSTCGFKGKEPLVCCGNSTNFVKPPRSFEKLSRMRKICGKQHSDDYFHSLNDTIINEFPWVAALGYKETLNTDRPFRCSGSLISRRHVLTSAHCVADRWLTISIVRLGEYHIRNDTDCIEDQQIFECSNPVEDFGIENITVHSQFNTEKVIYDIALIKLNRTVLFSDYIRPICLPLPGTLTASVGETLVTSGWGKIYNNNTQNDIKIKIYNKWVSDEECDRLYINITRPTFLKESRFCTSYLENNTRFFCKGDGGGPVMAARRNRWHQEGIISFAPKECLLNYPLTHTKVTYFLDWIEDNLLE